MSLQYLTYQEIDKEKWDACILESHNGRIYSSAVYLDHLADHWDALILDDYAAVMPLTWRKKWGIFYIYPPAFTQQLGISSLQIENPQMTSEFMDAVPKKFRYVEMNLNASNPVVPGNSFERKNFLLALSPAYNQLKKAYSRSA
ncbi:MAG: hypothetical protein H7X88_06855, partial [Gloeobacteraceae cyanobacterium ES-bin-316]|nr:hypothetical protein [Ferruginibacter sp.]